MWMPKSRSLRKNFLKEKNTVIPKRQAEKQPKIIIIIITALKIPGWLIIGYYILLHLGCS